MIQSLLRALELLEYLKEPAHDYTIAELADALQLPRSTVHRMLQTFCEKRFVVRDEQSHTYKLGPALISLGRTAAENISIQDAARPILKPVSYTHLDVYKRQGLARTEDEVIGQLLAGVPCLFICLLYTSRCV